MKVIVKSSGEIVDVRAYTCKDGVERFYERFTGKRRFEKDEIDIIGNKEEFLKELKALLEKHNASIDWCCDPCSDLIGVYDSHIEIDINEHDSVVFEDAFFDASSL